MTPKDFLKQKGYKNPTISLSVSAGGLNPPVLVSDAMTKYTIERALTAVDKAMEIYYDKGLTSTAAAVRKEILKQLFL